MRKNCIAAMGLVMVTAGSSNAATLSDISPALRKTVDCMVKALAGVPRFDHISSGVTTKGSTVFPFVEYRYLDDEAGLGTVWFSLDGYFNSSGANVMNGDRTFMAILGGLSAPNSSPPDWGTTLAGDIWKAKCGVETSALYI